MDFQVYRHGGSPEIAGVSFLKELDNGKTVESAVLLISPCQPYLGVKWKHFGSISFSGTCPPFLVLNHYPLQT